MDALLLINAIGALGLFSSRAFIPVFFAGMLIRFGEHVPWIEGAELIQRLGETPPWFTSDWALMALGALAALEVAAQHSVDAREMYEKVSGYMKSGMAIATTLGLSATIDSDFIERNIPLEAGITDTIMAAFVGIGVWGVDFLRTAALTPLMEADEDDDLGFQGIFAWLEDLWASFGVIILILFPILIAVITGLIILIYWRIKVSARKREEQSKVPCSNCQAPVSLHAVACGNCHTPVSSPRDVGFFGGPTGSPTSNPAMHVYKLLEKRRCPRCATRLESRRLDQSCTACGLVVFEEEGRAQKYLQRIDQRVLPILGLCALLGFVPVAGTIAAIFFYRIKLIAPMRRYIGRGRTFLLRWMIRLLVVILALVGMVPGVGVLALPLMALLNYSLYRPAFARQIQS